MTRPHAWDSRDLCSAVMACRIAIAIGAALCAACAPEVVNLRGKPIAKSRNVPFALAARLERLEGPPDLPREGKDDYLERSLVAALSDDNVFKALFYRGSAWTEADITLQGHVEETWPSAAGENFVTF